MIALRTPSDMFNTSHWQDWYAQKDDVVCLNSGKYDGLSVSDAVTSVAADLAALGVGEIKLKAMVRPDAKLLTYEIDFTKAIQTRRLTMGVADGIVKVDGELAYEVKDMKVALSES